LSLPVRIRPFVYPQDYPEVYTLWENAGQGIQLRRSDEPEELVKKLERDPDLLLVAEIDGELVGTVMGGFDGRRGMMYHLAVAERYRRMGIGIALVAALEQRLREKGCIRYYLLVTENNHQAISFYESQGFERMQLFPYAKNIDD
jgi:N-acetylglutamate synthase